MLRSTVRRASVAAALVTLGATPAVASAAPAVFAGNRCNRYIRGLAGVRYIPVAGTGWTPSSTTKLAYSGKDLGGYAPTNAGGAFLYRIFAPTAFIRSPAIAKTYTLRAKSQADPRLQAAVKIHMIKLTVRTPRRARPRSRVAYRLYGFPNRRRVWAHYTFGGKRRATTYMGRASRTCGTLRKRQRYLPARIRYGTWNVYFSNHKTFSRKNFILRGRFSVYRTYARRASGAAASAGPGPTPGPAAQEASTG